MTDAAVVQNNLGSTPIIALDPPPEGNMAAQVLFTLTPTQGNITTNFQLNSPGGFQMSQVVSLCVDNTPNAFPVTVIHGALSETLNVAAGGFYVVPTFSNKSPYPISVTAGSPGTSPVLTASLNVNITFLNYARQSGTFGGTSQLSTISTGVNSQILAGHTYDLSAIGNTTLAPAGNYILDSMDMSIDYVVAAAVITNVSIVDIGLNAGDTVGPQIAVMRVGVGATAGQTYSNVIQSVSRTWPNGLILPRNSLIQITVYTFQMVTEARFRINLSGYSTP